MASGRMEFHAQSIMQHANFTFVLPNDAEMAEVRDPRHYERPARSLILLHGLTGTDTDWLFGGIAQLMAIQYNLAVFMPTCGNWFYLDRGYTGGNCCTFIGQELPEYIRNTFGFCRDREDTLIAGLSMGGYGALHTAFAWPETFSACIALSSAIVYREIAEKGRRTDGVMPEEMVRDVFGDPDKILGSDIDLEAQVRCLLREGRKLPEIYMAIGTEDDLYGRNQRFRRFLEEEEVPFTYEDGPGVHDWFFWNEYLDRGLKKLLDPER